MIGQTGIRVNVEDRGTKKSSLISAVAIENFAESLIADSPSPRFLSRSGQQSVGEGNPQSLKRVGIFPSQGSWSIVWIDGKVAAGWDGII